MSYNEADTRAKLIDPKIHTVGWKEDLIRRETTAGTIEIINGRTKRKGGRTDYLYLFFQSQVYWNTILKDSRGGIMPNFNAEMLSKLKIPTPSKSIQEKFIKEAEILTKYNFAIIEQINQKLSSISLLPSSILNEVFGKYEIPNS